ncbi:MAG: GNAT family N-acetyltransferase [Oscillospiraceae bacterium]|nr:GNAT family N-acetyltransferase [Oscillospiraceae bacterium]
MKNHIYSIFGECFPQLSIGEDVFFRLLDADNCRLFWYGDSGAPAGFSAVCGNCIRLLCVRPDFRGKGIGSRLLCESEEFIAQNGFDRAVLGGIDSGLFIGEVVPTDRSDYASSTRDSFFGHRGYCSESGCMEMKMRSEDFASEKLDIPPCPDGVSFVFADSSDRESLLRAVEAVDTDWVQYFTAESPVLIAKLDGKTSGFCIINENADTVISSGNNNVGSIGCVGVVPQMRKKGIGLAMVAEAMRRLKQNGCTDAFIHYTYLDWWYGRLGFKTFLRYSFSEKIF